MILGSVTVQVGLEECNGLRGQKQSKVFLQMGCGVCFFSNRIENCIRKVEILCFGVFWTHHWIKGIG